MKLYLVEGYQRPPAKLDDVFLLKQSITHFCVTLARYRRRMPEMVPDLKRSPAFIQPNSRVHRTYYEMIHSIDFDRLLYNRMLILSEEERDGYRLMEFSKVIMELANEVDYRPKHLSPPLYYDGKEIKTLFTGKFWGRIEHDNFRHPVMIVRNGGVDKFFAALDSVPKPFPLWSIPYLPVQDPRFFEDYGTQFRPIYEIFKGLVNLWTGFKF